jgi:outer membrane murein-binding lipoprotein Lpp
MFGWLLLHVVIGAFYRPIRQGRKVAYLTLVSFIFLVALVVMFATTKHGGAEERKPGNEKSQVSDLRSQISDLRSQISDLRSQISDSRLQVSSLKPQVSPPGFSLDDPAGGHS